MLKVQFSGGKSIKGFNERSILAMCSEKFKDKTGWLHIHFKQRHKGAKPIEVQANSVINNMHLAATIEANAVDQACNRLFKTLDMQLVKRAHF